MAAPACHPCYPGSPSIGSGSFRQDRCPGLSHCRKGSTTPSCVSRLHLGSLALQPAGLLDSLAEPWSGNLVLPVTLGTSLQLRGRTTEFPRSDFNRLVTRFTRHTLLLHRIKALIFCRLPMEIWEKGLEYSDLKLDVPLVLCLTTAPSIFGLTQRLSHRPVFGDYFTLRPPT
jgi:hypothetical protein